jgi:hypothetical protein
MGESGKYAAPAGADEFYRQDGDYVKGLVRKLLGASGNVQDAEDAASDIMERLLVSVNADGQNALGQYDSGFTSERTGQRVTWRAFLSGKIALYMRGKREQVSRRTGRELLLCDTAAGEGGTRWVELFGGQEWDDYPSLDDDEFCSRMRDYLAVQPEEWDGPGLLALFDALSRHVMAGDDGFPLHRLGLSKAASRNAMNHLREAAAASVAGRRPGKVTVEGVELSAAEAREAVTLLKAGKGNHVHAPLRNHRLQAEAPKGWYHPFSAEERRLFPECATDPQTHSKPADHVKRAVIHRLERLLAEAGGAAPPEVPEEPEPELTREELLEAELWHIKGLDACGVDAVLGAVRKFYQ